MECRGFCRRLGLRVRDVPLLRLHYSTGRLCGLPHVTALDLALHALDYSTKDIAHAMKSNERTVRAAIDVGRTRIGARDRGDCVRILQETDADVRAELQSARVMRGTA